MGLDIGDRATQLVRREPAGHRVQGWPRGGIASEEVDHERIGQRLGVQLPRHALAFDRGLQHQRHVVEQGIVGGQGGHNDDALHLERRVECMHEQRRVHRRGGGLSLLLPVDPHQFAGRSGDHPVGGVRQEDRIKGKGQACRLLFPYDRLRG